MFAGGPPIPATAALRRQLCIPPQQISPSAARRSPKSSAMLHASRKVCAMRFVLPSGSFAHSAGLAAESMRITPYGRICRSRSLRPMRQAFLTCVRKRVRSSSSPSRTRRQWRRHTGATSEPARNRFAASFPPAARDHRRKNRCLCGVGTGTDRHRRTGRRLPRRRQSVRAWYRD